MAEKTASKMRELFTASPASGDFSAVTGAEWANTALAEAIRQKDALYQLTDRLYHAQSLDDVYDAALHAILSALPCDRASILLFDDAGIMRFVAWRGLSEAYRQVVEGHSPWPRDEKNPVPICIGDIETADLGDALKATIRTEGIGAAAFVPLVSDGKLIGKFMTYFNAAHVFGANEIELSLTIARQLAFAIERRRADEALRKNEQRFREMIDALPAAIYTTDADGRLTHFNPAAVDFSGRTPSLGTDEWCVSWKLFNSDGTPLPHAACPMAVALKEGRPVRGAEALAERPGGERRWFTPYPTPLRDSGGRIIGGINMLVDITERKQSEEALRQSEEQLRAVFNSAAVGVALLTPDARFMQANGAFCSITGYSLEELQALDCAVLTHPEDVAHMRQLIEDLLAGRVPSFVIEKRYIRKNGAFIHVQNSVSAVHDHTGTATHLVALCQDITERKQAEEVLRESGRRKDEFLATLSHELRNPLAPIRQAAKLLKSPQLGERDARWARDVIDRQVQAMGWLLDDLLDVSRISSGKLELRKEPVELAAIVESALELSRPLIEAKRHTLHVELPDMPVRLEADPLRVAQIISNLLTNAAKYTDPQGKIRLCAKIEGEELCIRVSDNGIGISADMLSKVFDMFSQATPALERTEGGLGIGLALVRGLVTLHGGSIQARSDGPGRGSEFTLRLPLGAAVAEQPARHSGTADVQPAAGRKVLVVDDNRDTAETLAALVRLQGYEVKAAFNGREALEVAETFHPDIALLDIGMPELNGYEIAQHIRKRLWGQRMTLVAVTGWGQEDDRRRAIAAGFDYHLRKPIDPEFLQALLKEPKTHAHAVLSG